MAVVKEITKDNFKQEVLNETIPVLVDFYTDGCGPCEVIAPILEELAVELEGSLKIKKFHVGIEELIENSNDIVKKYDVMGFPTLFLFKKGEIVKMVIGSYPKEELLEALDIK
ncbi:thioredoxin family protein [Metabacillus fastidiosus]|uniref:thioredoxin family protein n=1 Tax=Metabacillus fastidiosus TaxID=1458 RepID=UPI002DBD07F4|nr:thioredoxin domain-containing protein [Metabacillus fastidiosus]MEC2076357.1 thioredoxin domain-containing protein [Metabacillus fastidiosus]